MASTTDMNEDLVRDENGNLSPKKKPVVDTQHYTKDGRAVPIGGKDGKEETATSDRWQEELQRQRDLRDAGGTISPKESIMGASIGRAMEKSGADESTIQKWIGKKMYEAPPKPDPVLEKTWGAKLDSKKKKTAMSRDN